MSDICGLISQYGFEFQKKVFMHYLVHKMDIGVKLSYELLDDLDYSKEELGGTRFDKHLIQCKTGDFKYDVFKHVVCNWILNDKVDKYYLYLDSPLTFKFDSKQLSKDIKSDVDKYMNNPKKKPRSDCFKYKVNLKFNGFLNQKDIDSLEDSIKYIIDNFEVVDKDINKLEEETKNRFILQFGANATINFVKESRFKKFDDTISNKLKDFILLKTPYTIDYREYNKIGLDIASCITDTQYSVKFYEFKKGKEDIYKSLLNTREAIFLKNIHIDDKVIARYLTNELYYRELKDYYLGIDKEDMIDHLEDTANLNYLDEKSRGLSAAETFRNTIDKSIDDIVLFNADYKHGCYVFLSSDEAKDDYFIDWCGENEKE